jgi:hypothetical protein
MWSTKVHRYGSQQRKVALSTMVCRLAARHDSSLDRLGNFLGETVQHFGKCFRGIVYSPWEHQSS